MERKEIESIVTKIIYENSHDNSGGLVIYFENIQKVIDNIIDEVILINRDNIIDEI